MRSFVQRLLPPLSFREYELVTKALHRYADIERSAGNTITATLFDLIRREIEKRPLRGAA